VKSLSNTFVITTNNELYGWGTSTSLGLGTTTDAYYPVNIPMTGALAGKIIVKLDGYTHMVMLTQDGAVFGWGSNGYSL
jgi:alpha-tubulin suppressor-like RCC1 family protein